MKKHIGKSAIILILVLVMMVGFTANAFGWVVKSSLPFSTSTGQSKTSTFNKAIFRFRGIGRINAGAAAETFYMRMNGQKSPFWALNNVTRTSASMPALGSAGTYRYYVEKSNTGTIMTGTASILQQ